MGRLPGGGGIDRATGQGAQGRRRGGVGEREWGGGFGRGLYSCTCRLKAG